MENNTKDANDFFEVSPYFILENPKTEKYNTLKQSITNFHIPWRYSPETVDPEHKKQKWKDGVIFEANEEYVDFPFLTHTVIKGPIIKDQLYIPTVSSELVYNFIEVLNDIFKANNIIVNSIMRVGVNFTTFTGETLYSVPHVDHEFPHNNMIIYLTDFTEGELKIYKNKKWNVYKPKEDDVVLFSGYHAHRQPQKFKENRICIVTTFI